MINGFENETHELTEYELSLVPLFVKGLESRIGEERAITNQQMNFAMQQQGYRMSNPRVRKVIHHIRVERLLHNLIATSRGYYIENDLVKLGKYVKSLDQRILSIQMVRNSYNEVSWMKPD